MLPAKGAILLEDYPFRMDSTIFHGRIIPLLAFFTG